MKLIDFITTGKQVKTIPKSEIPALLGEIETLKARLWARLTEWEDVESIFVLAKTAKRKARGFEDQAQSDLQNPNLVPQGRILRMKEVIRLIGCNKVGVRQKSLSSDAAQV